MDDAHADDDDVVPLLNAQTHQLHGEVAARRLVRLRLAPHRLEATALVESASSSVGLDDTEAQHFNPLPRSYTADGFLDERTPDPSPARVRNDVHSPQERAMSTSRWSVARTSHDADQ